MTYYCRFQNYTAKPNKLLHQTIEKQRNMKLYTPCTVANIDETVCVFRYNGLTIFERWKKRCPVITKHGVYNKFASLREKRKNKSQTQLPFTAVQSTDSEMRWYFLLLVHGWYIVLPFDRPNIINFEWRCFDKYEREDSYRK